MKTIKPLILIVVAVALFFVFTDPTYRQAKQASTEAGGYNDVLAKSTELLSKRKTLQDKSASFATSDMDRLKKLLPDTVDNVRLIIDIDEIAKRYGLTIKNIRLDDSSKQTDGKSTSVTITTGESKYGTIPMGFSVTADYDTFLQFLRDLESSLRIVDVVNISLKPALNGQYTFDVSLKTYWLK